MRLVIISAAFLCLYLACSEGEVSPQSTTTPSTTPSLAPASPSPGIAPFYNQCFVRAAEPPQMPTDSDAQLMGIVVHLGTATTVPGVDIAISETGQRATSDALGHFYFNDLASAVEPEVRRTVFVDDDRFAQWEVRRLSVHLETSTGLIVQVSESEPFFTEHRTPGEIEELGVFGESPINSQPTAAWETFNQVCDPWTGEPTIPAPP